MVDPTGNVTLKNVHQNVPSTYTNEGCSQMQEYAHICKPLDQTPVSFAPPLHTYGQGTYIFCITFKTKNVYHILLCKWFIIKDISIFIDAEFIETDGNASFDTAYPNVPSTSVNKHCLKSLDKNLHKQQAVAVNEGSPNILQDPRKGKAPATHTDLLQNSKKNNG